MRKAKDLRRARTILSVFLVWSLVFSGAIGFGGFLVALAADEPIEPTVDWTVRTAMTMEDDNYLDGNLVIVGPQGNLTIRNGGLTLTPDYNNRHTITITNGGVLYLENAYLTVETDQIDPYYLLRIDVAGLLYGQNAVLQFPGHINVTVNGRIILWDSLVTGLSGDIPFTTADDRYNDAPVFYFNNAEGQFYRTRIDPLFAYTGFSRLHPTLGYMYDFNVTGTTKIWFVDSFLDIDYDTGASTHNVLYVRDSAKVYAYNMTIDTSAPGPTRFGATQTSPAPSTANVTLFRWADVLCVDSSGVPIQNIPLTPELFQTGGAPYYPDLPGATPPDIILQYIGKTSANWKITGADGKALLPLPSEFINYNVDQTEPNSDFLGAHKITGRFNATTTSSKTFSFNPYPAMDPVDGTHEVILVFPTVVLFRPDLRVSDIQWWPDPVTEPDTVYFSATIENFGQGGANDIYVWFYVDGQQLNNTPTYIGFIAASGFNVTPTAPEEVKWVNSTGGTHSIRVVVDFLNTIKETDEGNNVRIEQFYVIPRLPDYNMTGGISFPPAVYIGSLTRIDITVANSGNKEAPSDTVRVYIGDPVLGMIGGGEAFIGNITVGSTNTTFVEHTFDKAGEYRVCAWVDFNDNVEEADDTTNNVDCTNVTVGYAPNLVITTNDIGVGDPCTRMGQQVRPQALVRNLGYVDAGAFKIDFFIDGDYFASGNSTGILANQSEVVLSGSFWAPSASGIHNLSVAVDPDDSVRESNEADNWATKDILIFDNKMIPTYGPGTHELKADKQLDGNVDITGDLTIMNAHVDVFQPEITSTRYCIKVYSTGSLTLDNATLTSNYPLVIYVTDSASFTAINSNIELDWNGTGGLYSDSSAQVVMEASTLRGSLFGTGDSVSLKGVDLHGADLYIETASTSYIWDSDFITVTDLHLLSDDGNANTVDFDIRNITDFLDDPNLFNQLIFRGNQLIELTSVLLPDEWWLTMVTENAKVRIYWWVTVKLVDGTGSLLLEQATSNITFEVLNVTTLQWDPVPGFPVNMKGGLYVDRTLSLEMQAYPIGAWVNSTYAISADVTVGTTMYYPDTEESRGNWTGKVHSDMTVELQFSSLTPDFSVTSIDFVGPVVVGSDQPVGIELAIQATIYNSGNIDSNNTEVFMYRGPQLIGWDSILVPAAGYGVAIDYWTPTSIGPNLIMVCVDVNNTKAERDEDNNCLTTQLNVFGWPNLAISTADVHVVKPIELAQNPVVVTVRNIGTATAVNVVVRLDDDEGGSDQTTVPLIAMGGSQEAMLNWTPQSAGPHNINITVFSSNETLAQSDYDWSNNFVTVNRDVLTRPDLEVDDLEVNLGQDVTVGANYPVDITIRNNGGADAFNFSVILILDNATQVGQIPDESLIAGQEKTVGISADPIDVTGAHTICALIDPDDVIVESVEDNNMNCTNFIGIPPYGSVSITNPTHGQRFDSGENIWVSGWVQEDGTNQGLAGIELVIILETTDGSAVGTEVYTISKGGLNPGIIDATYLVPQGLECDTDYRLRVYSNETYISQDTVQIKTIECPTVIPFWVWLLILIIIIVVVAAVAVTLYMRYVGLGKLVECGECGAFIPEDSTSCPKCGVEFETETAKCSSCQAWIPLKVKKCPECGVEFATGEVEMEDYKAKMKMQYDEVRARFKAEAEAQLGKTLTDAEFESWWRTQPTFMTFDQWLKQEEDMRKMGSKPCPSCGTLNSVTATVCHKCGALMVEEKRPRRPPAKPPKKPGVPPKKAAPAARPPEERPPVAAPAAVKPVPKKTLPTVERPVPKKVIKKPVMEGRPAVVPKKVARKPEEEEEETY